MNGRRPPTRTPTAAGEQINGYDDNAGMRRNRVEGTFLHMVSDGDWKVIYRPHMPERGGLFHIATGRAEAARSDFPAEYLRLMADLAERNPWVLEPFPEVSQRTNGARISSLGYSGAEQGERGTGPAPNTATSSPMSGDATEACGRSSSRRRVARGAVSVDRRRRAHPVVAFELRGGPRGLTLSRGHFRTFRSLRAPPGIRPPAAACAAGLGDTPTWPALLRPAPFPLPGCGSMAPRGHRVDQLTSRGALSLAPAPPLPRSPPAPWPHRPCRFSRPRYRRHSTTSSCLERSRTS